MKHGASTVMLRGKRCDTSLDVERLLETDWYKSSSCVIIIGVLMSLIVCLYL